MTTIRRAMMPRTSQWGRSVVRAVPHLPGCHGTGPDDNIDRVCLGLDYSEPSGPLTAITSRTKVE